MVEENGSYFNLAHAPFWGAFGAFERHHSTKGRHLCLLETVKRLGSGGASRRTPEKIGKARVEALSQACV